MNVFAMAGSLRKASLNKRLAKLAAEIAGAAGHQVELRDFRDFSMPVYDGDLEEAEGIPAGAMDLKACIERASAVLLAAPEYNQSVAGPIKNAVDWLSRIRPVPLGGKQILLLSASPGMVGGNRGLWALRVPLELLGVHVYPDMFSVARAHEAFDDSGALKDEKLNSRLEALIGKFLEYAGRAGSSG